MKYASVSRENSVISEKQETRGNQCTVPKHKDKDICKSFNLGIKKEVSL